MYEKSTVIKNRSGLHARPASEFIECAKKFKSEITIQRKDAKAKMNAKSIIALLSLGLSEGEAVRICAAGEDEGKAVDTLIELIGSGFGEL